MDQSLEWLLQNAVCNITPGERVELIENERGDVPFDPPEEVYVDFDEPGDDFCDDADDTPDAADESWEGEAGGVDDERLDGLPDGGLNGTQEPEGDHLPHDPGAAAQGQLRQGSHHFDLPGVVIVTRPQEGVRGEGESQKE